MEELEIEAALERVRARTMSMHQSSELAETATVLFEQLSSLGAKLWICGFAICKKDNIRKAIGYCKNDCFCLIG